MRRHTLLCIVLAICVSLSAQVQQGGPADNVKVADTVTFGSRCEVCFACVHNCPQGAIHLKNEKSAVRFRNENVSLSEISDSNGRSYQT